MDQPVYTSPNILPLLRLLFVLLITFIGFTTTPLAFAATSQQGNVSQNRQRAVVIIPIINLLLLVCKRQNAHFCYEN
jgi:hypothetical protein